MFEAQGFSLGPHTVQFLLVLELPLVPLYLFLMLLFMSARSRAAKVFSHFQPCVEDKDGEPMHHIHAVSRLYIRCLVLGRFWWVCWALVWLGEARPIVKSDILRYKQLLGSTIVLSWLVRV